MIDYNDLTKNIKDGLKFPTGATSERGNPSKGSLRFNSETGKPEIYAKSRGWKSIAQESSGSSAAYITTDLVVDLDAGNPNSYSGSGNTWTDLKGNTNYTWQNKTGSPTYNSGGWIDSGGDGAWLADSPFTYLSGNDFTLDIWVKLNNYSDMGFQGYYFSSIYDGAVHGSDPNKNSIGSISLKGVDYRQYSAGELWDLTITNSSGNGYGSYTTSTSLLDWHNIVFVSKTDISTTHYYYVNGVARGTTFLSNFTGIKKASTRLMTLGGYTFDNGTLLEADASIASFRVYDKQLSATEVADNFSNTKSRFGL